MVHNVGPDKLCELHVHLEGCVWPEHVRGWWGHSQFLFPPPAYQHDEAGFAGFLEHIRFGYNFLNSADAYANVAGLYTQRCITQNIVYAELQINLALLRTWNIKLSAVLSKIHEQCAQIPAAPALRFIIDLPWQFDARSLLPIIDDVATYWELGVRAISMGGDESLAKPHAVAEVFKLAREAGLKTLCHAGETTTPEFAQRIVESLEPDRVAHGVHLSEWIVKAGEDSPPIDVCLSSNIALGVVTNLQEHPLLQWWEAGVPFSLSTDDPAIFNTDLRQEYTLAAQICAPILENDDRLREYWIAAAIDPDQVILSLQ